jgi:hypothetical protein
MCIEASKHAASKHAASKASKQTQLHVYATPGTSIWALHWLELHEMLLSTITSESTTLLAVF